MQQILDKYDFKSNEWKDVREFRCKKIQNEGWSCRAIGVNWDSADFDESYDGILAFSINSLHKNLLIDEPGVNPIYEIKLDHPTHCIYLHDKTKHPRDPSYALYCR